MRKFLLLLIAFLLPSGVTFAERGEPMEIWPILVQIDWDAYHGKAIENCSIKYPDYANSFRDAIVRWNENNMKTILEIRRQLKDRLKSIEGLSEAEATTQMSVISAAWTAPFLKMISSTPENSWKDVCTGKYAAETLRSMDFVQFFPIISSMIPTLPINRIRP